jgi:hypothetical protein
MRHVQCILVALLALQAGCPATAAWWNQGSTAAKRFDKPSGSEWRSRVGRRAHGLARSAATAQSLRRNSSVGAVGLDAAGTTVAHSGASARSIPHKRRPRGRLRSNGAVAAAEEGPEGTSALAAKRATGEPGLRASRQTRRAAGPFSAATSGSVSGGGPLSTYGTGRNASRSTAAKTRRLPTRVVASRLPADAQRTDRQLRYAVLIDAGSSGSRVHVYRYSLPAAARNGTNSSAASSYPAIDLPAAILRIRPGLSTLAGAAGTDLGTPRGALLAKEECTAGTHLTCPQILCVVLPRTGTAVEEYLSPLLDFARQQVCMSGWRSAAALPMAMASHRIHALRGP